MCVCVCMCVCVTGESSWPTELGHTFSIRVPWYTKQIGCVLALVIVGRGRLTWVSGKPSIHARWLRPTFLGHQGPSRQTLNCSSRAKLIVWLLRHPFFGECRQDPRHLWSRRGCIGYGPALKRLCTKLWYLWATKQIPIYIYIYKWIYQS